VNPFAYQRATAPEGAVHSLATDKNAKLLGGGTNLVDLMKQDVERPTTLIDITRVEALSHIEPSDGGHLVGALVRNSDLANDAGVRKTYPLLSQALLSGATTQLRNLATTGGNLMQRTRCYYFYDPALPSCNKRAPGSGCGAINGFNRIHAILGQTDEGAASAHTCIATNPSDMNVALSALNAVVEITGPKGKRHVPVREFHRLVGKTPELDTNLQHDELITGVHLPASAAKFAANSYYLKARDRQSYAFALVSVAAGLEMDGSDIKSVALALGGVAHKPWSSEAAERAMVGKPATESTYKAAAEAALQGAKGYEHNAFKIELAKSCIVRAFTLAAQGTGNHGAEGAAA
jgi:xanthine dehydrogenase YagS FAD-binding subunit